MPVGPSLAVGPAPREEWRLSLRNTARDAGIFFTEPQLLGGVEYQPLTLGTDNTGQFDPCADFSFPFAARDGNLLFLPWAIYAWEDCPTIGAYRGGASDVASRAIDKLSRQTSYLTAQTLWTGQIPDAPAGTDTLEELAASVNPDANNRRLASSASTLIDGLGAHDITDAFGHINKWVSDRVGAERVWIHLEPRLLPFLAFYGLARRGTDGNGRVLDTALSDHRIIADAGYDGSEAEGRTTGTGESWIYVTTPVRFFESPIVPPGDAEQILNRSTNRYQVGVSRMVLAEWDLTLHGAIKVCTPGPGPECSATGS